MEELGTATATITFFRSIGSSLGGALFGTILVNRLTAHLYQAAPQAAHIASTVITSGVAHVPPALRPAVFTSYVQSFRDMFIMAVPFAVATLLVALFLREVPLRDTAKDISAGESLE